MADGLLAPVVVLAVSVVALFGGTLFVRQTRMIFRPRPWTPASPADLQLDFDDLCLRTSAGEDVHAWWVPGLARGKAIVFFHGSDGNISYELGTLRFLHALGASVLMIDYPGYGRSGGRIGEQACYRAAEVAWTYVCDTLAIAPRDVVVYGHSLGAAVATYLCASRATGGLVFHSGFSSVPDVAAHTFRFLPVRPFCRTRMDSLARMSRCQTPLLVLHAEDDAHIPIQQARRVYRRAAGPKRFVVIDGPHGSTSWQTNPEVRWAWDALLDQRFVEWESASA